MKQLKKKKLTRYERERLCQEVVASIEAWFAILVLGALIIATPICIVGGLVELILKHI